MKLRSGQIYGDWKIVNEPKDVIKGDYVMGVTATYSQKWLIREGYEEYNATVIGTVTSSDHETFFDITQLVFHNPFELHFA